MQCLITGDSHTGALQLGLNLLRENGYYAPFDVRPLGAGALLNKDFFILEDSKVKITHKDKITSLDYFPVENTPAYTAYGFSGPLHLQPVVLDRFFHEKRSLFYTDHLLKCAVLDRKKQSLAFIAALQSLHLNVFVIEPPYTFRHHPRLQENMRVRRHVPRVAEFEKQCRGIMKEELAKMGVAVAEIPAYAINEDGLMKDDYRHPSEKDKHHGNASYGSMMLLEALALLQRN